MVSSRERPLSGEEEDEGGSNLGLLIHASVGGAGSAGGRGRPRVKRLTGTPRRLAPIKPERTSVPKYSLKDDGKKIDGKRFIFLWPASPSESGGAASARGRAIGWLNGRSGR